ncbi:MAG: phosphatidylinositol-specific phospholipase C/glycerophosphodiester phosphodiesterase family protein [Sphingomicrobium sp.]
MEIIAHRRNLVSELVATPPHLGVEVDIRSRGDDLIIHHDPYAAGELLEHWLGQFRHGLLILNVKEEGLEDRLIELMAAHGIDRFFFLDQSFPFLLRTAGRGERRCAVRVSEFESIETALSFAGRIEWVWVDCFTRFPLDASAAKSLVGAGFRLCLVSPELQGRPAESEIPALRRLLEAEGIAAEAVCTKHPELWA